MWSWTFGFHKMAGISWVAEGLLASQEGLLHGVSYGVTLASKQWLQIETCGLHVKNHSMANRKTSDVAFVSFVFIMHVCELAIMSKNSTCLPENLLIGVGLALCS
jgi:hypothetical protein